MQLVPDALARFSADHRLSSSAQAALAWIVLLVDPRERVLGCSVTTLAEMLRMGRHQASRTRAELERAGAITWLPPIGSRDGRLVVRIYDQMAAQGRRELGDYVPVLPDALDAWCTRRDLCFGKRDLLLRILLATDDRTRVVSVRSAGSRVSSPALTVTDIAATLRVNRRRALQLVDELPDAVCWGSSGELEVTAYEELVLASGRAIRATQPGLLSEIARIGPASQDFFGAPRDPGQPARESGQPARDPGQPASESGQPAARSGPPNQGFYPPTSLDLSTSLPCATNFGEGRASSSTTVVEGKEEDLDTKEAVRRVLAQVATGLACRGEELHSAGNAGALSKIRTLLAERLGSGWAAADLVAELTTNMAGAASVVAVALARLRNLPDLPPAAAAAVSAGQLAADSRRRQTDAAAAYGRNRSHVEDLDDDELEADLLSKYGDDSELLQAARAAAGILDPNRVGAG